MVTTTTCAGGKASTATPVCSYTKQDRLGRSPFALCRIANILDLVSTARVDLLFVFSYRESVFTLKTVPVHVSMHKIHESAHVTSSSSVFIVKTV